MSGIDNFLQGPRWTRSFYEQSKLIVRRSDGERREQKGQHVNVAAVTTDSHTPVLLCGSRSRSIRCVWQKSEPLVSFIHHVTVDRRIHARVAHRRPVESMLASDREAARLSSS